MANRTGPSSARAAVVLGALLLVAGCAGVAPADGDSTGSGASGSDQASGANPPAESPAEEAPADGNRGERIDYTGDSEAHVVYAGVALRFAADGSGDNGHCIQTSAGMLSAELHLVEVDGAPHNGAGSNPELVLEVPLPSAGADERGGAHLFFAGGWVAGDTVYNVSKVDTPDITLVASGATITGTQKFVAASVMSSARDAEVEITLECR